MSRSSSTTDDQDIVIDLRADDDALTAAYQPDRVIAWLRSSGGNLGERAMKSAAADLIEDRLAATG